MATDKDRRDNNQKGQSSYRTLASQVTSMGFSVVIFVLIGVFLDSTFKTAPIFILLGVFFSLASMGYILWQIVRAPR